MKARLSFVDDIVAASSEAFRKTQDFQYLGVLELSQRVAYAKLNGVVPFGTVATVIGTTFDEETAEQLVQILTDVPLLGKNLDHKSD